MPGWLIAVVVGIGLWVAGRMLWRRRQRRALRAALLDEAPAFQVTVLDAPRGRVRVRIVLGGSSDPLRLVRLSAPRAAAERVGLFAPGFRAGSDAEAAVWTPVDTVVLRPGEPADLELGWDPDRAGKPVAVQGWAEGTGGRGGAGFAVLVGPRAAAEVELANRRSALLAEARALGVPPSRLPGWAELEEEGARRRRLAPRKGPEHIDGP